MGNSSPGDYGKNRIPLEVVTPPALSHRKILRVQLAFERREAGRSKEFLEIAEEFGVRLVFEAEHIFEDEEIQGVMLVEFLEDVGVVPRVGLGEDHRIVCAHY